MTTGKRLFVAVLSCREFATFKKPTKGVAIVAVSHDEAMGKAIAEAKRTWRSDRHSEHTADVTIVPQEMIDQVAGQ